MDEEIEEFIIAPFITEEFVIDIDYEFDAAQYYDFTQAETLAEAREAERWFESAASCPPSPFIAKSKWRYGSTEEIESVYCNSRGGESMSSIDDSAIDDNNRGLELRNQMDHDTPKSQNKSGMKSSLSRSSTLMKPTASYLAKHNQPQEVNFNQFLRRSQKLFGKMEKSLLNSSMIENLATKRQKLDAGYLRKVSHLKHQALFLHKVPKKDGPLAVSSVHVRSKVTIPREPNLETAYRAQRLRSKVTAESGEDAKSNACCFKARPLNRKIFDSPALPLTKKSTLQPTECQEFQLRTSERARQHACKNVATRCNDISVSQNETRDFLRLNPVNALKEEKRVVQNIKSQFLSKKIVISKGELGVLRNIKQESRVPRENDFPSNKTFLNEPPIELFNKLALASDVHSNIKPQSKTSFLTEGSKENTQGSFHLENEMMKIVKKNSPRFGQNQYQCGSESSDKRINEVGARFNINRNLDIR